MERTRRGWRTVLAVVVKQIRMDCCIEGRGKIELSGHQCGLDWNGVACSREKVKSEWNELEWSGLLGVRLEKTIVGECFNGMGRASNVVESGDAEKLDDGDEGNRKSSEAQFLIHLHTQEAKPHKASPKFSSASGEF